VLKLKSKIALVAGASRGIGLAIAKCIAEEGARTILASRSIGQLEAQAKALREEGLSAAAVHLDFTSSESIKKCADTVGTVDILVNVAGTNIRKPFEQYTRSDYDFIMQTNLHGIFELTQKIGAKMQAKGGKIINIGSLMSTLGLPYAGIYAISKGAIGHMTKALAAEWAKYNIQVNCIAPGFILTDMNRTMWEAPEMAEWRRGVQANPRMGSVEDIAPLAAFLASKGADYITGQIIAVDGGYTTTAIWPFQP
jgi:NAD(P)-dependent dehydrogenase (short-subunit alcohol dehydrogenase family)